MVLLIRRRGALWIVQALEAARWMSVSTWRSRPDARTAAVNMVRSIKRIKRGVRGGTPLNGLSSSSDLPASSDPPLAA